MKYEQKVPAFTLIEIVVAVTILVILSSIWFYSYVQNLSDARDGVRKTDLAALSSQLNLYKRQRGAYPVPGNWFEIQNRGNTIAVQWLINNQVALTTADQIADDPYIEKFYTYSITNNRQEFQLSATLENQSQNKALLVWSYSSVSKNILPTLIVASNSGPFEIVNTPTNKDYFIFDKNTHNLAYDFSTWNPKFGWVSLTTLLSQAEAYGYWQNTDFRSCDEIARAAKRITPDGQTDEYQIRDINGNLVNQNCSCTSTGCVNTP